jgi:uncharacterized membrane protein
MVYLSQRRHHPFMSLALLGILLPLIFILIYFQLAQNTFRLLGLSREGAIILILISLVGANINVPLIRRRVQLSDPQLAQMPEWMQQMALVFHYYPPAVEDQVIAVNVGGALVPLGFSIYLLTLSTTAIGAALVAIVIVAVVTHLLARPMPGIGITLPGFVPPIVAALAAHFMAQAFGMPGSAAAVAYIAGTLGTLLGADLLNLPFILRGGLLAAGPSPRMFGYGPIGSRPNQPHILSIGGAGVFDGIFLTGIVAPFLAG